MRVVIQRVRLARVEVDGQVAGGYRTGFASAAGDRKGRFRKKRREYLVEKVLGVRIFPDKDGKMNRNVREAGGSLLVVSQFTLYGDCPQGAAGPAST
jgi:D-tyrosyl-tRNA(Tyr) deacylase